MPKVIQVIDVPTVPGAYTGGIIILGDDGSVWSDTEGEKWRRLNLPAHFAPSAPPEQPRGEATGPAWAQGLPHDVCLCNAGDPIFHAHYYDSKKCARCKCTMFRSANPPPPAHAAAEVTHVCVFGAGHCNDPVHAKRAAAQVPQSAPRVDGGTLRNLDIDADTIVSWVIYCSREQALSAISKRLRDIASEARAAALPAGAEGALRDFRKLPSLFQTTLIVKIGRHSQEAARLLSALAATGETQGRKG